MRKESVMNYNEILAEAMDCLDERYAVETAKCLLVPAEKSERNVTINSEDLIEIKNGIRKSNFISTFVAVAAVFICVAVTSIFFILSNNRVQTQDSQSISDLTSDAPESGLPPIRDGDIYKSTDRIVTTLNINGITKFGKNTLFVETDYGISIFNINSKTVIREIAKPGGSYVQIYENGFVIIHQIDRFGSYDMYDISGNLIKHVDIPTRPLRDDEPGEGTSYTEKPIAYSSDLHFSADGKSVVYFGENGFCVNSSDFDNEVVLQPSGDFNGGFEEFYYMSDILLFKDDVVYGGASKFNSETEDTERYFAAFNVKTKEWTIYGRKYSTYMLSKSNDYANNSIRFVNYASDDENAEEIISYFTVGDIGLSKFVPEEIPMERDIYISSGGRFILTAYETEDREKRIKLYDVETGEVLLSKVTYFYVYSAYIDESERRLYVVSDDIFMMDF